jgi:hypothetical protein
MKHSLILSTALTSIAMFTAHLAWAGQAPGSLSEPDIPVSHHDRVYAAEQFWLFQKCSG